MLNVGDVVRIKTGNVKMTITHIDGDMATCRYIDENDWNKEKEVEYSLNALVQVDG